MVCIRYIESILLMLQYKPQTANALLLLISNINSF